jgi:hypothetical protein
MLEILAAVSPCTERSFVTLEQLLLRHVGQVTSCVCVFVEWDEPRRALVQRLRFLNVPVQAYVVTGGEVAARELEPGPFADCPQHLHPVAVGKVQEAFAWR